MQAMCQFTHDWMNARQNSLPRPRAAPVTMQTWSGPLVTGNASSELLTLPSIENDGKDFFGVLKDLV